ncbi:MAG TPA: glycosyltransferase [Collinsella ihuae]|uniref:Glycosyltransferase n=1 Tax=Collinsella ihumii TaxID=1720204 RepID=A0A921IMZ3_9ACTN|nr:glycosyltransferase [Collinsella ihumii]
MSSFQCNETDECHDDDISSTSRDCAIGVEGRHSPKVSIVIPVYNTPANLLCECINSAVNQCYQSKEVIVVDDGSDAVTAEYLDSFAEDGIAVLHKNNGGLSDARNYGVAHSTGDYVYFLDSDDSLASPNAIQLLVAIACASKSEIVVGRSHFISSIQGWMGCPAPGHDWLVSCLQSQSVSFIAPDQLFAFSLLRRLSHLFVEGMVHEDEEFTPRAYLEAKRVVGSTSCMTYTRNIRAGSLTQSKSMKDIYKRCEGKMLVAKNLLSSQCYSSSFSLRSLIDARAYGFMAMAFRSWAEDLYLHPEYSSRLMKLAESLDYSRVKIVRHSANSARNYIVISFVRAFGIARLIDLLNVIFKKKI